MFCFNLGYDVLELLTGLGSQLTALVHHGITRADRALYERTESGAQLGNKFRREHRGDADENARNQLDLNESSPDSDGGNRRYTISNLVIFFRRSRRGGVLCNMFCHVFLLTYI